MGIDTWARFMLQRILISWQFRTKRLIVSGYYEILIIAGKRESEIVKAEVGGFE